MTNERRKFIQELMAFAEAKMVEVGLERPPCFIGIVVADEEGWTEKVSFHKPPCTVGSTVADAWEEGVKTMDAKMGTHDGRN